MPPTSLDRTNLRRAYGWAVVAWAAAAGLTGTTAAFARLVMFRLMLGLAE